MSTFLKSKIAKYFLFLFLILTTAVLVRSGGQYLTLDGLKLYHSRLAQYVAENEISAVLQFGLIYIVATALSIPGAAVLTLAAGALFGLTLGTILVSFSSTIGASLAFLISRYLLKEKVGTLVGQRLERLNDGIKREGGFYLFSLRLVPVLPFFLINLGMGITAMRLCTFFWVSQLGMLPGTIAYVNAGTQLSRISSLSQILSWQIILSFAVIGFLPLIAKRILAAVQVNSNLKKFKKPDKFDYNIIVIGAGSGGLVSAYIASALKAKVALIEQHKMGGDCLNTGCVPSKALIRSAKILHYAKRSKDYGIGSMEAKYDFASIMERVQKVIKEVAPHDSIDRYSNLGVECIQGKANINTPYEVLVNGRVLTTKNIIIATGARPLVPSIPGLEQIEFLTSDTVWSLRELPKRLIVLGGGPIGTELAQCFQRLGAQVTQIETNTLVLKREDPDVGEFICKRLRDEGIKLLTSHRALRVEVLNGQKTLVCSFENQEVNVEFDQILLALGRKANVTGFGLEELGVKLNKQGTVEADEFLRTNFPNIYVVGDVTGPYQFTHFAAHQAWYAAINALSNPFKSFKTDYRVIPWCTFTDPEVARVGLSETEAKDKKIPYEVTKYGIDDLDRAIADSAAEGFVKVLTKPNSDKILGATIVGASAGELLTEFVLAMKHGLGLNKILGTIHIYPTMSEANKYAAGVWKRAHVPKTALALLKRFHQWRRS